ncbi:hypothetical protein TrVE_jg6827 [Triparma verrucosa]|uniref:Deacetylase sirtuin-type domain-containing protein n=1 Tax=Triparma verrucosa TaxID=1606542 RepID=A0A9W7BJ01_9STRA|nr:hypothetical protein TrVE_jg6827 [Triparma verrucosa]
MTSSLMGSQTSAKDLSEVQQDPMKKGAISEGDSAVDVSRKLSETIAGLRRTSDQISKTQSNVQSAITASQSLENKWQKFQADFDKILNNAIGQIAKGMGVGVPDAAVADEGEGMTTEKKFEVLGNDCSMKSLARRLRGEKYKNVVILMGAGCSVSTGIPDFRTKGTGLYSQVEKYNLPYAEAIFDLHYFNEVDKTPFHKIAKEMYPDPEKFKPTLTHKFVKLLQDKGMLLRCYTQNIDGLERLAGVHEDKLVEAHGSFLGDGLCGLCKAPCDKDKLRDVLLNGEKNGYSGLKCEECDKGFCKPPIVFFGENLPARFGQNYKADMQGCDLCIVMGTSLKVAPFSNLVNLVPDDVPRMLVNRELVGDFWDEEQEKKKGKGGGVNYRDVVELGDCDDTIEAFCKLLGYHDEIGVGVGLGKSGGSGKQKARGKSMKAKVSGLLNRKASGRRVSLNI